MRLSAAPAVGAVLAALSDSETGLAAATATVADPVTEVCTVSATLTDSDPAVLRVTPVANACEPLSPDVNV